MRSVSVRLEDLKTMILNLGFAGENEHTRVTVDCKKLYDQYPNASASLTVQPPEGEAYPAVIERDGDNVIWDVMDSDLIAEGSGELQLSFTQEPHLAKSYIGRFKVGRSIIPTGEVPEPLDDFLTRAGAALTAIPETINSALAAAKASGEFDGPQGPAGQDGADGQDGFSPMVAVSAITGGHQVSVTDAEGTETFDVMDGVDGQDGTDGNDGVTPEISIGTVAKGTDPAASMDNTDPAHPVLSLTLPKGDKGDQGDPAPAELVTTAVNAYLEENISNPSNPPLDRSLSSSSAAAPADIVGNLKNDLNNIVYSGKQEYATWYQGARSSDGTISQNTKRCTSDYIRLKKGNCIKVSGIPSGYKFAFAGKYDDNSTLDSGWQTGSYEIFLNEKSGYFFVNAAKSDGTTALTPSDITGLKIEVISIDCYFASNDRVNVLEDRLRRIDHFVDYGYGYNRSLAIDQSSSTSTAFGVSQNGTEITIDSTGHANGINSNVYIRIWKELSRTSGSTIPSGFKTMVLEAGHTYEITVEYISGSSSTPGYFPAVGVYKTYAVSEGTLKDTDGKRIRTFTAASGVAYAMCLYLPKNVGYSNMKLNVTMKDVTEVSAVFDSEIASTVDAVKALQTEPSIVFPLATDIHYGTSENGDDFLFESKTIKNMRAVAEKIQIDFEVCLGDITNGDSSNTKTYAATVNNLFKSLGSPYLLAIGNHDDNRYETTFTAADVYACCSAFTDNHAVFNKNTNGRDYYVDMPNYNVRFVVLDSNTIGAYGFSEDTVTWLSTVALDTPEDCLVVVLVHESPISTQNYNNSSLTNGSSIESAIVDYLNSGKPIIQLYGHSHCDVAFTSPYLSIGTNCAKFENTNGDSSLWPQGATKPSRTAGTVTEDCWDMVVLRPLSRKIDFVRFGAGSNRSFTF